MLKLYLHIIKQHIREIYGGMEADLHTFLTLAVGRVE
jgi:hypothetical protein